MLLLPGAETLGFTPKKTKKNNLAIGVPGFCLTPYPRQYPVALSVARVWGGVDQMLSRYWHDSTPKPQDDVMVSGPVI